MRPALMVKATRIPRKSRCVWGAPTTAFVVTVDVATLPAAPTQANNATTVADQPYFAYHHLDQARAERYTGKGITIAMTNGEVAQNAAELVDADVVIRIPCTISSPATSRTHGADVVSILVSSNYDIAPDASLLAYRAALGTDGDTARSGCRDNNGIVKSEHPWPLNRAINDGVRIINVLAPSGLQNDELKRATARLLSQGVIVTATMESEVTNEDTAALSQRSGVIGISAIDINGNRQNYSPWR